jgi:transcriptional regulator GlxA family with amidase domain
VPALKKKRRVLWGGLAGAGLSLAAFGAWILSLPAAPSTYEAPPVTKDEADATLAALRPPKRARPLIAIIGINDATETTDYLMPYGILSRAGIADVVALATAPGAITLDPALTIEPDATVAEFDARNPEGADYVIVPKMTRDDDAVVLQWLRSQAAKGATVIGVCAGAKVVGRAGLLDGKRATTHWYYLEELRRNSPDMRYVADRRLVADVGVATTTGISASMPMSLTLIEAIAGRDKAEATAKTLGLSQWDARHDSSAFQFTRPFALTTLFNVLPFWKHETLGIELRPGLDEVSLALVADAWSRTFRSHAVTLAVTPAAQETLSGLRIVPDVATAAWSPEQRIPTPVDQPAAQALDGALQGISRRYGARTADLVAMQLEYPSFGHLD